MNRAELPLSPTAIATRIRIEIMGFLHRQMVKRLEYRESYYDTDGCLSRAIRSIKIHADPFKKKGADSKAIKKNLLILMLVMMYNGIYGGGQRRRRTHRGQRGQPRCRGRGTTSLECSNVGQLEINPARKPSTNPIQIHQPLPRRM